ncbi:tautomerase PptA [Pantoea piersonii]|uniref:Tautomerase PptA n=1 Tax=Pantoea piersonii TaxID=2364647 RepID=A0AAJ5QM97_9GAMM|nr:tautomerase PptA [Pantoea piersonii]WBG92522.1 tautomerase PptA [Pantoea piersonii]
MPHLDLHFNPRELSEDDIANMASELCEVLRRHLGTNDGAISLSFTQVTAEHWKSHVYDPLISPVIDELYKAPGYTF